MTAACVVEKETIQAFDLLADSYDDLFTHSLIGRAQRDVVWDVLLTVFEPGARILEMNCGTGEDALFLARHDVAVVACDASAAMIEVASKRLCAEDPEAPIHFLVLPTEQLGELRPRLRFNGALSNFSGLNCVSDLGHAVSELARLVASRSPVVICVSTRFCLTEMIWYFCQGKFRKAFRRATGQTTAKIGGFSVNVHYPTLQQLKRAFAPCFRLRSCKGIGLMVPPSYLEPVIRKWPRLLSWLRAADQRIAHLPGLRVLGDHMLLHFERVEDPCR